MEHVDSRILLRLRNGGMGPLETKMNLDTLQAQCRNLEADLITARRERDGLARELEVARRQLGSANNAACRLRLKAADLEGRLRVQGQLYKEATLGWEEMAHYRDWWRDYAGQLGVRVAELLRSHAALGRIVCRLVPIVKDAGDEVAALWAENRRYRETCEREHGGTLPEWKKDFDVRR